MMHQNKLLLMIANFLHGSISAQDFSFQFPGELADCFDMLQKESPKFAEWMNEQMPELCAAFDPYGTNDSDTIDEETFRKKVAEIYIQALQPMLKKIS